mgnify:CR=1 FL=1
MLKVVFDDNRYCPDPNPGDVIRYIIYGDPTAEPEMALVGEGGRVFVLPSMRSSTLSSAWNHSGTKRLSLHTNVTLILGPTTKVY